MNSFSRSIWLGLLAAGPFLATALSSTVEQYVVFPKNNTAYKPMHPFPFVLAVRNWDIVTSSIYFWWWSVAPLDSPSEELAVFSSSGRGHGHSTNLTEEVSLTTAIVHELRNSTAKEFIFTTGFGINDACDEEGNTTNLRATFNNTIYFSFDTERGEEPDLLNGGPCATSIGILGVQKEIQLDDGAKCLVLESDPPSMDECLKLDAALADEAAFSFTRGGRGCYGQTWPDVGFLRGKCDPQSSGSDRALVWTWYLLPVLFSISAVFLRV